MAVVRGVLANRQSCSAKAASLVPCQRGGDGGEGVAPFARPVGIMAQRCEQIGAAILYPGGQGAPFNLQLEQIESVECGYVSGYVASEVVSEGVARGFLLRGQVARRMQDVGVASVGVDGLEGG